MRKEFLLIVLSISFIFLPNARGEELTQQEIMQDYKEFFTENFPDKKFNEKAFKKYGDYAYNFHDIIGQYKEKKKNGNLTKKYEKFYQKNVRFMMKYYKHFLLTEINSKDINKSEQDIIEEFFQKKNEDLINLISQNVETILIEDKARDKANRVYDDMMSNEPIDLRRQEEMQNSQPADAGATQ